MNEDYYIELEAKGNEHEKQCGSAILFNSDLIQPEEIFSFCNYKYTYNYVIEGDRFFYKEGHVHPGDVLFYKENEEDEANPILMSKLMVFAVQEFWAGSTRYFTLFFRCLETGSIFYLPIIEYDLNECPKFYAYKLDITEQVLRQKELVEFYNTRYFKLKDLLAEL